MFRPDTLRRLDAVATAILDIDGVVVEDVLSLSTTDDVTSGGGLLSVDRIMTEAEAINDGRLAAMRTTQIGVGGTSEPAAKAEN